MKKLSLNDDINKAIEVIKTRIDYVKMTEPSATKEIDMLEFAVISLEGWRDADQLNAELTA